MVVSVGREEDERDELAEFVCVAEDECHIVFPVDVEVVRSAFVGGKRSGVRLLPTH